MLYSLLLGFVRALWWRRASAGRLATQAASALLLRAPPLRIVNEVAGGSLIMIIVMINTLITK